VIPNDHVVVVALGDASVALRVAKAAAMLPSSCRYRPVSPSRSDTRTLSTPRSSVAVPVKLNASDSSVGAVKLMAVSGGMSPGI